ncbi:SDR family NAD(P)-dependent oxidoreductase [Pseudonocardia acaciae]|uniref:SDR family NAD(P)-dependent oxidoreductase n=1 Tax=Pseudonocardia acaciae TaxID=551276 RepID=UPI0006870923|nr:SDR family oxidoreductase [Pseudonocardia acaciae]
MADQDGRVAIVTGGAAGIGLATALRLASDGAHVVCGDRDPGPTENPAIGSFQVDLSSPDGPADLVTEAIRRHGRLDVLVNNVGMATRAGLAAVTDGDWDATFRLNLMCAVRATRAGLDELRRSPAPSVVFVASTTARVPDPYFVDYAASKAAVLAVAKALSEELGPDGIRVNSVSPGSIRTPLWDRPGGFTESITRRYRHRLERRRERVPVRPAAVGRRPGHLPPDVAVPVQHPVVAGRGHHLTDDGDPVPPDHVPQHLALEVPAVLGDARRSHPPRLQRRQARPLQLVHARLEVQPGHAHAGELVGPERPGLLRELSAQRGHHQRPGAEGQDGRRGDEAGQLLPGRERQEEQAAHDEHHQDRHPRQAP